MLLVFYVLLIHLLCYTKHNAPQTGVVLYLSVPEIYGVLAKRLALPCHK